jgi:nitroimidazol reductase NimA-like FMN-containing flavoprotein (pyridoxamine 5'-phosphate oxidase superfamily)
VSKPLPPAVKSFLDGAHVCRISSVGDGGAPHVIPVCPVFDGESTVYVDIGEDDVTAVAVRSNPRIAVLFDEYDDDWAKLRKVLLKCTAEAVTGDAQQAVWERIRAKYPQYATVGWRPRLTLALRIKSWTQTNLLGSRR